MTKQEEKLFKEAKSHIIQLSKIANEFEKLDLPFSISISNRLAKSQAQTVVECLKEVKECFLSGVLMFDINSNLTEREQDILLEHYEEDKRILADIIDNKIKELEEEK